MSDGPKRLAYVAGVGDVAVRGEENRACAGGVGGKADIGFG